MAHDKYIVWIPTFPLPFEDTSSHAHCQKQSRTEEIIISILEMLKLKQECLNDKPDQGSGTWVKSLFHLYYSILKPKTILENTWFYDMF